MLLRVVVTALVALVKEVSESHDDHGGSWLEEV